MTTHSEQESLEQVAEPAVHDLRLVYGSLLCGVAAPFIFVPFVLWAGAVTPGYSQISSTFSDAAAQGQPYPQIMGTGLLLLALALALSSYGIARSMPRFGIPVGCSLFLAALAITGTGIFRDYNRHAGSPRNLEGLIHNACASLAILSIILATLLTGIASFRQPGWRHLFAPASIFTLGAILAGITFQTGSDARDGLAERAFALFAFTWLAIVALNGVWFLQGMPDLRGLLVDGRLGARQLPVGDPPADL